MEINLRRHGSVTIIDLSGHLILGRSEEGLRDIVNQLLAEGRNRILLNLAEVPVIDSSGIGAMIKSFTSVKSAEGTLKILRPSRMARHLLNITGLFSIVEIYEEEEAALASFSSSSPC